jgi:hypothetical protein
METLRTEHPHSYRRIYRKGIVHILLGISLLLPAVNTSDGSLVSKIILTFGFQTLGLIFLSLGLSIILSTYRPEDNYKLTRRILFITFIHDLIWLMILIIGALIGLGRGSTVLILWGYLCYNMHEVLNNPGFKAMELVKEIKENS